MPSETKLELQAALDGLGQGVLVFTNNGNLVLENLAARSLLGTDINRIRSGGWEAVSALFNTRRTNPDEMIDAVRDRALKSERPVHFYTYLSGEYTPCWAAAVQGRDGEVFIIITLDKVDWGALKTVFDKFRVEMQDAVQATQGHIDLINQTIKHHKTAETEALAKHINGFTRLISIHMDRVGRLMEMMERMEEVRTGAIKEIVRQRRRKIDLENFLEDFVEELDEIPLVDPETEATDHRSRLTLDVPGGLAAAASATHLTRILRDLLRNAIMYSMKATPIKIRVSAKSQQVQFDVVDEGYGVREKENERVFEAFERARQPQIIAEFGYGLSLYLCKHEVEAMNGRMWFESEEGVGSTFSFMLPLWREETASSSDSSARTSESSETTKT